MESPAQITNPLVSVVIPTLQRPAMVLRAVGDVLTQTWEDLEILVALAGEDPETERVLAAVEDRRLRLLPPVGRLNPAQARNRGVREARGRWTAFLDDDDRWRPEKLERQLEAAERSAYALPVVSCRVVARSRQGDVVWPRRGPRPGESIGDYLFVRRGLFGGGGLLQTSTLFAPTELCRRLPFREDLARAEDLDWALRADRIEGCGFELAGHEPLAMWDIEDDRPRASSGSWRDYADWIAGARELVSRRAYASYLLTEVSAHAARRRDRSAFLELARRARAGGDPAVLDWAVHAAHWVLPESLRRSVGAWLR